MLDLINGSICAKIPSSNFLASVTASNSLIESTEAVCAIADDTKQKKTNDLITIFFMYVAYGIEI